MTTMTADHRTALPADWRDFVALTKPRVMSLVVFTGLCGLLAAPVMPPPVLGFTAILCIALGAGAAGALNQWYEADLDALMKRTAKRPLPAGRMDRQIGAPFRRRPGGLLGAADGACDQLVSPPAILAVSILFYVLVYTVWLKRRTPQNIVIGGAAGAFPPLIGWAAATGERRAAAAAAVRAHLPVDAAAFLGAVAVRPLRLCRGRRADAAGDRRHRAPPASRSSLYTVPMAAAAVAPWPLGLTGAIYGIAAAALSLVFVALASPVLANRATEPARDEAGEAAVRFLDPLSVRAVRRAGRRPVAAAHDRPERRRRSAGASASRAMIMALAARRLRHPALR